MADEIDIIVGPDGSVQTIYDDDVSDLFVEDAVVTVSRASHVEPWNGGWVADMGPVGGPVLGFECSTDDVDWSRTCRDCARFPNRCDHVALPAGKLIPFQTRRAALDAEVAWLRREMAARKLEVRP